MNSESPGLISIERVVAFVVGPAATALSGYASAWLAERLGVHLGGAEILGLFATGGAAAAGLAYKWLHGRQVEMGVEGMLAKANAVPGATEFLHTTLADLEGLAQKAATEAVEHLGVHTSGYATVEGGQGAASGE
jgi:hypothetical protein